MLPDHHLLSLVPNRIGSAVERLFDLIWEDLLPLSVEATTAGPKQHSWAEAKKLPRRAIHPETFWGKLFDQRWCKITLPASAKQRFLNWRDQGEATLYIDGKPYFGFDIAHRFCRLPAGTREVWIESNCIHSAIDHPEATGLSYAGSKYAGAFLCNRNEEAWEGYHDLKCLLDVALNLRARENPQLSQLNPSGNQLTQVGPVGLHQMNVIGLQPHPERVSPAYRQLLRQLDQAVDALDSKGIAPMRKKLAASYDYFRTTKTFMNCTLTGHAHIDLVWLWPERLAELKAVHTFSTVNRLMDDYPELRFAYSQPASYEAVKRRSPDLYRAVQKRIQKGQWQATGAMYVESDTQLACGEALARSFMLGQRGFTEINGQPTALTWLPDVFGYSACLPQLMKLAGVDYFFTTKMTWNAVNRFPYSSFIWRGNDGSEVVAHVTQDSGYNTRAVAADIIAPMMGHQQADVHHEYLLPTGFGDGGGGPTDEMCENARRLGNLPGLPGVKWDHPESFFKRLNKVRDKLPTHQGECYLEYHRGTYTTHGDLKETFRALERALQVSEAVAAATGARWDLEHSWKRLVFAQFHDYIPGSSVPDVYIEGLPELRKLADAQKAEVRAVLEKKKGEWCVFNPHALPVQCTVRHPGTKKNVLVSLPPLSGTAIEDAVVKKPLMPVTVAGRTVSNGLAEFTLNTDGCIASLTLEGQNIPLREPLGQMVLYPDRPAHFDSWDIDRQTLSLGEKPHSKVSFKPWQDGEFRRGLQVIRDLGKDSQVKTTYALEAGSSLVEVTVELEWNEPQYLLKMHFPTAYAATHARFGAPFGSVLRPQVTMDLASEAKWEVPFSRYLAVFDDGETEGLFVATEAKYGATVRDGDMGISLVRSPHFTGLDKHSRAWPEHLSRVKPTSPFADIGSHVIKLALGRYASDLPREKQPAAVADTFFTKPVVYQGRAVPPVLQDIDGGQTLVPAWVMPLDDGSWLLRLHEVSGRRGTVQLQLANGWKAEKVVDLEGAKLSKTGARGIAYTPYQILSFKVSRKKTR
jgi:alpha-mannosidase